MKRAFVTGIAGQDGSFLAELLLEKQYEVHGLARSAQEASHGFLAPLFATGDKSIELHVGDLRDRDSLRAALQATKPDEIYNLASQSNVRASFDEPGLTAAVNAMGTANLLEAMRELDLDARYYQASSSEMFGQAEQMPLNESSAFRPQSPYACSKVYAHWLTVTYREAYGIHASNGILFNHESERRGADYVTRKITSGVARIKHGLQDELVLGNLDVRRDWGYAPDYVEAMWLMLQQDTPDDYVVATGEPHSVREFVNAAFAQVGLNGDDYVKIDPAFFRPTDAPLVVGDASKARERLGWRPSVTFGELVARMVDADLRQVAQHADPAARLPSAQ